MEGAQQVTVHGWGGGCCPTGTTLDTDAGGAAQRQDSPRPTTPGLAHAPDTVTAGLTHPWHPGTPAPTTLHRPKHQQEHEHNSWVKAGGTLNIHIHFEPLNSNTEAVTDTQDTRPNQQP